MSPLEQLRQGLEQAAQALSRHDAVEAARSLDTAGQAVISARGAGLAPDDACRELHRQCESLAAALHSLLSTQVREAALSSRAAHAYRRSEASGG